MKLTGVELIRLEMLLVEPFRTSFGTQKVREVLLVRTVTPEAEGWGECVALSDPVYSSEYVESAAHVIRHHLLPRLFALPEVSAHDVAGALRAVHGHRMAKAALEMAVLDAELRALGEPLASYLGGVSETVEVGVSVGIMDDIQQLTDTVAGYVSQGYGRVKLKIEPGWDVEPVKAVRECLGEDLPLQVDANAAYQLADAPQLAKLDAFGLLLIEQPLGEEEILAHAKLAQIIKTPVCLDESVTSAQAAADAIALGACAIVNIKPGRVGGYLEGRRVHDVCQAHGVPVWCGGMLETGIGRAANLALASLPNFSFPSDISASDRYYHQDITPPFVLKGGSIRVPEGPGIGVSVITEAVDEFTRSKEFVSA